MIYYFKDLNIRKAKKDNNPGTIVPPNDNQIGACQSPTWAGI